MSVVKLVIVCDEKRMDIGSYLSQLLSSNDDDGEITVGVKDGSVDSVIWAEENFIANAPTVSSKQFVLFIGNSKIIKEKTKHMEVVSSDHGIIYKCLGKQAAITVDKVVSSKDYESFIEYAKQYSNKMESLINNKTKIEKGVGLAGVAGAMLMLNPLISVPTGIIGATALAIKHKATSKKIEAQMYACGVMKFYLENINNFLGLDEAKTE